MSRSWFFFGIALVLNITAAACGPSEGSSGTATGGSSGSSNAGAAGKTGGAAGQAGDIGVGGFAAGPGSGGSNTGGGSTCMADPKKDNDGDGFSGDGTIGGAMDCNDCDKNVGPGAVEVIAQKNPDGTTPDPADEDCDGTKDNVAPPCDDNIALDDTDPYKGAAAIDICQKTSAGDPKWGILNAAYTRANGMGAPNTLQFGVMDKFGTNVPAVGGARMLALSSGNARDVDDPNPCGTRNCKESDKGVAPPNFPQQVCNASPDINDDVALDLKIKVPQNAIGYSFNFRFYSFEFAEWVCTSFNDQFIALASPAPPGSVNGNISFDSKNNPVSVNIGFFDVCDAMACNTWAKHCITGCPPKPAMCCPSGSMDLLGTGFDVWDVDPNGNKAYSGGTSWLKTQAPVKGGSELNLRFTIWDAGDQNLDSTVLVDNFKWIANGGSVKIETVPDPVPE